MSELQNKLGQVAEEVRKVIIGKDEIIDAILMTILANGHVLLEDIPGVGKTTLALAFSQTLSLCYHRMQFTPDVLPADVTGFSMYQKRTEEFVYREGAVMCNLFLADEINRTSPKTQSALLEVMEEGKVTVDGVTRELPRPFFVIATQNPLGSAGTQKLPESQLDRFMVRLSMGYPDATSEARILKEENQDRMQEVAAVLSLSDIIRIQEQVRGVHVEDNMYGYIAAIMALTRDCEWLRSGVSPRGAKALLRMARSCAFMQGREYIVPEDVQRVLQMVCLHRITLSAKAKAQGRTGQDILEELVKSVPMPVVTQ